MTRHGLRGAGRKLKNWTPNCLFVNSIFFLISFITFTIILPIASRADEGIRYDAKGKRDPFTPLQRAARGPRTISGLIGVETVDEINLEGLVYDPEQGSIVVANGSVLTEGQQEGDVRVVEIREDGALFEIRGKTAFKPFSPLDEMEGIKQP
jgi:hypothetical protein